MMKRLFILSLIVLSVLILNINSQATVIVDDADSNAESAGVLFTSAVVPTGSGQVGDYELIACGVRADLPSTIFFNPAPGTWTELDQGDCGQNATCGHGIWGRFTDNPASEDITCSWDNLSAVFAAGSFRYNDVDPDNPIIAVACTNGAGEGNNIIATAPSVDTVAGSQVARIYTYRNFSTNSTDHFNSNDDIMGSFTSFAAADSFNVTMRGETELFEDSGPTGEASIQVGMEAAFWRACTIALRMAPVIRNVPTMSEWGFIAVAASMGIAGIWFLRRRQAQGA